MGGGQVSGRLNPPYQGQATLELRPLLSGAPSAYWALHSLPPSATSIIPLTKYSMEVIFSCEMGS